MYFDANGIGKKFKDRAILYWAQTGVDLSGDGNNHSFERFSTSASAGDYSEHHLFFLLIVNTVSIYLTLIPKKSFMFL